jgi:hypothetical protein
VGLIVFRPHARQGPRPRIEVDFAPFHFRDFTAPLAGQEQQLHHAPERPPDRFRRPSDGDKLIVG